MEIQPKEKYVGISFRISESDHDRFVSIAKSVIKRNSGVKLSLVYRTIFQLGLQIAENQK